MTDVLIGRLVKAFGIRGELKLDPSCDFWEDVLGSENLVLRRQTDTGVAEQEFVVKSCRPHGNCFVLEAEGVADRNQAEALVGSDVVIDASKIDVELPDEVLPFQVVGAKVVSVEGKALGEVTAVIFSPAHDLYEVTGERGTFLVPAVPEFVTSVDDIKREIVIKTIPGLIDKENEK